MSDFSGKVVLVTGAGRGTGRAMAEMFAALGAKVAANDVTPINLDTTIERILAAGGQAQDFVYDVALKMPAQGMIEQIIDIWGRLDCLVNCARVEPRQPLLTMDEWDWRRTVDVNLTGVFFLIQSAARVMKDQGGGAIVNVISSAQVELHSPGRAAFLASQAGLLGLTREAARELAPEGVRVNAICLATPEQMGAGGQLQEEPAWRQDREGDNGVQVDERTRAARLALYLCDPTRAVHGRIYYSGGGKVWSGR